MKLLKDSDASLEPLEGKTVAILGYGNQGRAQALNLRDSGVSVIVGNRDDAYRKQAIADGFKKLDISEAARQADVLLILTTDEPSRRSGKNKSHLESNQGTPCVGQADITSAMA